MAVTAADVKKLRDATGAGPADCKKALEQTSGDFEGAVKLLKEKGLAAVEKRADRAANEGRIFIKTTGDKAGNSACIVELTSETDFVARNPDFIAIGEQIAQTALERGLDKVTDELARPLVDLGAKIREKMTVGRICLIRTSAAEYVATYIHGDAQNLGVAVVLGADSGAAFDKPEVKEFAHNLALHVAAFNPRVLDKNGLDAAFVKEQEDIFRAQMKSDPKFAGKPDNVITGALQGKLRKYLASICFVDQPYVKDDKLTVSGALDAAAKSAGCKLSIKDFTYIKAGA